ncbi:hypothetical protein GWI33_020526 [Rhynchophorus ferrugineus]|uniref:Uncharacterized protein n=1 Tax=Rhynchophorus ferrugineus TaxID=354439 RepID=A0A834LZE6_RHYFE|nr:hypothetical protein GWI33_020526 [Rhynchophorus ferrugineus]
MVLKHRRSLVLLQQFVFIKIKTLCIQFNDDDIKTKRSVFYECRRRKTHNKLANRPNIGGRAFNKNKPTNTSPDGHPNRRNANGQREMERSPGEEGAKSTYKCSEIIYEHRNPTGSSSRTYPEILLQVGREKRKNKYPLTIPRWKSGDDDVFDGRRKYGEAQIFGRRRSRKKTGPNPERNNLEPAAPDRYPDEGFQVYRPEGPTGCRKGLRDVSGLRLNGGGFLIANGPWANLPPPTIPLL